MPEKPPAARSDVSQGHGHPALGLEEKIRAQDEEIRQLKQRLYQQAQRLQQAHKLLAELQQPRPRSSRRNVLITVAIAAGALAGVSFLYLHFAELPEGQPVGAQLAAPQQSVAASPAPQQTTAVSSVAEPPQSQPSPGQTIEPPVVNADLSHGLSEYLHNHKLPHVDALVFSDGTGAVRSVKLSGEVRTGEGKKDAAAKCEDFFDNRGLRISNRIEVNSSLVSNPAGYAPVEAPSEESPSATGVSKAAGNPCTELCIKDEGYCKDHCQNEAASSATGPLGKFKEFMDKFDKTAVSGRQCNDDCEQTRDHCVAGCNRPGAQPPG